MVEANKHIFVKHLLDPMRSITSAQCQPTAEDWFNKGVALEALGKTTEANAAYTKAKELGYSG